ncbi:hypothetical protein CGRA01v4_03130 [Colletotrichum graminicola]|uniref:Uncharacterized protein n=1 Tax=Colletotrichum graminicola (strain M1.001 / M2 / FGSC 10212) TaxID=645133 RepID=E3QBB0_COLGM|nr:uncharacterized protein GLRG_03292 [Colletotrichum graminicola M1.001]EFQ28148.1 hypothetical protein GLRG_03292 [Colletotrichum graminicola M1.001]WDK11851.1 hypothetical protein CGRA01v4_03130 [Colletotrichum graminicola]
MDRTTTAAGGDDAATESLVDMTKTASPKSFLEHQHHIPQNHRHPVPPSIPHRRTSSGANFFSKLPFMRSLSDGKQQQQQQQQQHYQNHQHQDADEDASRSPSTSMSTLTQQQQQKSRRRKGSLRKVALLGRGAQRERREAKQLTIDTSHSISYNMNGAASRSNASLEQDPLGLNISDLTPRPSMDGYASRSSVADSSVPPSTSPPRSNETEPGITSPTISYTSTTDEDDVLHIANHIPSPLGPDLSLSSGSDSYFKDRSRRRSILQAKSPLSYSGLSTTPLPPNDAEWDYSETEWWGWVVLVVTWIVFVIGMGSVLGIWSWAWDVGTTPYAPPELEDDPTLPIVGYYPALMILTCIMAWVWVVVAWVGMKYFRHAKISGE